MSPELLVVLGLGLGWAIGYALARWLAIRSYNKAKREYDLACEAIEKLRRLERDQH